VHGRNIAHVGHSEAVTNLSTLLSPRKQGLQRLVRQLLALVLAICLANCAFATTPCPPPPCRNSAGDIDVDQCRALAGWVAIGKISDVAHHEEGFPLLKDFAEFTFTVDAWEKGTGKVGRALRFKVGWCDNWQTPPKDISGRFRFYGVALPTDSSTPNQFLYFEPVQPQHP
jgi:hypothetical protein